MIRAYLENIEINVAGLQRYGAQAKQYAFQGVIEGLKIAYASSLKLISVHDYSLQDLADMGHPYGASEGPFKRDKSGRQVGAARGPIPFSIEETIEVQSAEGGRAAAESYFAALTVTPPVGLPNDVIEGKISIEGDEEMKLLDRWLQEGTIKMKARPWMEYVEKNDGPEILEAMRLALFAGIARDVEATGIGHFV